LITTSQGVQVTSIEDFKVVKK